MVKVAILMCCYDGDEAPLLDEAIVSMLSQTHRELELHIYLDGVQREDLLEVLARHSQADPRVVLHRGEGKQGLAFGLNVLITELRGKYDYYARMDADDVSARDRLAKQIAFLSKHPEVDIVGGFIRDMDYDGRILKVVRYPTSHDEIRRFFRKRNPMAHVTVVFRDSYFDKAGLYDRVRSEDTIYWMKGLRAGAVFANIPECVVDVRMGRDFFRRRGGPKAAWQNFQLRRRVIRGLGLGPTAYVYAAGLALVQLSPVALKRFMYRHLR